MLPVLCSARGIIEVMCFIDIGNELFSVILFNIFHIVLEIESLSQQQQLLFYIDLVCGVFTGTIQFEQSMPRPIVPNVCFDKQNLFKRLCQHLLDVFSNGSIQWHAIKTKKPTTQPNGTTIVKYVKNTKRNARQILFEMLGRCASLNTEWIK
eukprot:351529_1